MGRRGHDLDITSTFCCTDDGEAQTMKGTMLCASITLVVCWITVVHAKKSACSTNLQSHGMISSRHATSIAVTNFHCNVSHIAAIRIKCYPV